MILSPIFLKPFQTCGDTDTVLDSCSASAGDNGSDIKDSLWSRKLSETDISENYWHSTSWISWSTGVVAIDDPKKFLYKLLKLRLLDYWEMELHLEE